MQEPREYYVIEFKEPLVMDQDRYICVPKTWVSRPFSDPTPQETTVVVKYPLEKQTVTRLRVRKYENYDEDWKIYIAFVKLKTDSYKDAMAYIKLLQKSSSEQINRAGSIGNATRDNNQSSSQRTDTEASESHPPEGQESSSESPVTRKPAAKRKYVRKSQNNTNEQESINEINSKCEAVIKDHEILKNDLMGFFSKFLPLIERVETNIVQNSIMIEKMYTILVDKTNSPIDETIATVSRDAAGSKADNSETTNDANVGTHQPVSTMSQDTTPVAEAMEVEVETEGNNTETIVNCQTHDVTTESKERDATSKDEIDKEASAPVREELKRKLVDTDANVPMKKRDGPRNPTLQNGKNISEIHLNNETTALAEVESGIKTDNYIFSHKYLSFINDALKISSLYQKN